MAQQNIDFGTFPDDPDADAIRTAFQKVQYNFDELYATTTSGSVTAINKGAGIDVNQPTGNVIVSANIACVQVSTSSLSIGIGGNGLTSAILSNTSQTLYIDINPSNVFSANFAANSSGGLANITGTLTVAASSQPNLTTAANLTTIGTLGNLTVTGTFNAGNLISANYLTGVLTSSSQPNITSIGNLGNLVVTGNSNLGNLATANFFSGDGGLLSNIQVTAGTSIINGTSNVTVGSSSNVNISVAGNTNVITVTSTGANVNGYLTSSGNITATNASLGNAVTANFFIGSGANLTNIAGSNVSGTVANATYAVTAGTANSVSGSNVSGAVSYATTANSVAGANVSGAVSLATSATSANSVAGANVSGEVANATYATSAGSAASATTAGTVTANAQPNITSVGTLTTLDVNGTITASAFTANTGIFTGNGSGLSAIAGGNVTGTVANATFATTAGTAGTVTIGAQPNITSVGTLTSLSVTGNVTANNFIGTLQKSVTGSGTTELVRGTMATNDLFRIMIGGTGVDSGYVELATADNGDEPIYVRQYSGDFASLTRTLTLLDANGNSSFPNNVSIISNVTANNLSVDGNITGNINGFTIGYRDVPQIAASNTTLAATDAGKHYYSTTAGNITLTIPNNATTSFSTGAAISIVVQAAGNILVNAASGVTLYMAGNSTAANRVVGSYGMATLLKVATDTWFINGTGVS